MIAAIALSLLLLCLPLGTAALEISTGLVLAAALPHLHRTPPQRLAPVLLLILLGVIAAIGRPDGAMLGAVAVAWTIAPALTVPLLRTDHRRPAQIGLHAAAAVGLGALLWALWQNAWPARGPFSHHLTLGYALLPPLAVALAQRRWALSAAIGAGVMSTLSLGPMLSLLVLFVALRWRPLAGLGVGALAAIGIIAFLAGHPDLAERAVLWSAGAALTIENPLGVGVGVFRPPMADAQDALSPGFYFPLHAHDSALQIGAVLGVAGWVGWAWLLGVMWQGADRAGRAGIAAVLIGGLTQDTLGDLEVIRAVCVWSALNTLEDPTDETDGRTDVSDGYAVHQERV